MKKIIIGLLLTQFVYGTDISTDISNETVRLENKYIYIHQILLRRYKYEMFLLFAGIDHPHYQQMKEKLESILQELDHSLKEALQEVI